MKSNAKNRVRLFAALSLLTLTATGAHADTVFSNFGPGDSFIPGNGWSIGDRRNLAQFSLASSFSVSQNYFLTGFDVAAWYTQGFGTNSFLFSIVEDSAGLPLGSSIFSTTSSIATSSNSINSFSASGSLVSGTTYWLIMGPGVADAEGAWNLNNTGATGYAFQVNSGPWSNFNLDSPAFRINGRPGAPTNVTPEVPGAVQVIPVLLAVGGMALYQRKKASATGI